MLPTPVVKVGDLVYEPAEDSFLLLDCLEDEQGFLDRRFGDGVVVVVEIGAGLGIVSTFVRESVLRRCFVVATDVNPNACAGTLETVKFNRQSGGGISSGDGAVFTGAGAEATKGSEATGGSEPIGGSEPSDFQAKCSEATRNSDANKSLDATKSSDANSANRVGMVDACQMNLCSGIRTKCVDVMVFNPPYVPGETVPEKPETEDDGRWLDIALVGGKDGLVVTWQVLDQLDQILAPEGVAYVLFCARNRPDTVGQEMEKRGWLVDTVGHRKAGWEVLTVLRFLRQK